MRFSSLSLLPAFALLAACSQSSPEQQTTTTETMADTAAKVPAVPTSSPPDTVPAPNTATAVNLAPDTANVQNVAAYLAGLLPKAATPLAELAAQPTWQAFAKDQDKSWVKYRLT
ncbi:MAG: hypothetical protein EOO56_04160, partial [Hymenobacter sp.]